MIWNVIVVLAFAIIISLVSYYIFGVKGPWENFWIKALLLFLFLLAASLWIKPFGPDLYGVQWLVLLIGALLFILLLAAFTAPNQQEPKIPSNLSLLEKKRLAEQYNQQRKSVQLSMGMMFWLLLILLILIISAGYYFGFPTK